LIFFTFDFVIVKKHSKYASMLTKTLFYIQHILSIEMQQIVKLLSNMGS